MAAVLVSAAVRAVAAGRGRSSPVPLAGVLAAAVSAVALTGLAARGLLVDRPPSARAILGGGFWLALAALAALAFETARGLDRRITAGILAVAGAAAVLAATAGLFDVLSLAVEYRARADQVHAALTRHLALAAAALGLAAAISVPLAWAAFRSARAEGAIGAGLNGVQVVPAIALFGLLLPVLSLLLEAVPALRAAGLRAIGPTPAVLGVASYLALPLVRALVAALRAADPAVVEAARAMGMGEGRLTREVRLPLGLPLVASGLRTAAVQGIGLTTLGGLVGAGGLGGLVFEGMAQFAPDLILLGALPVVGLALLADGLLRAAEARVATAGRR